MKLGQNSIQVTRRYRVRGMAGVSGEGSVTLPIPTPYFCKGRSTVNKAGLRGLCNTVVLMRMMATVSREQYSTAQFNPQSLCEEKKKIRQLLNSGYNCQLSQIICLPVSLVICSIFVNCKENKFGRANRHIRATLLWLL